MKVDFFIVGARKCGTTALSEYLSIHPDVCMAVPKEPTYFADDLPGIRYVTDLDDYEALFNCKDKRAPLYGEASPSYLYSTCALENIYNYNPEAKIIVMLRNPVDAVYSAHSQLLFSLFEDQIDFNKAFSLQSVRKEGHAIPAKCREPELLQYKNISSYPHQLERLFEIFPRKSVKIILFDDFVKNTKEVYEDVLKFLGLDAYGKINFSIRNPRKTSRNTVINNLIHSPPVFMMKALKLVGKGTLHRIVVKIHGWINKMNTKVISDRKIPPETRKMLSEVFKDDIRRLEKMLERNLSSWK